jgi:hypothetical protein
MMKSNLLGKDLIRVLVIVFITILSFSITHSIGLAADGLFTDAGSAADSYIQSEGTSQSSCSYTISPSSQTFGKDAGSGSVGVSAGGDVRGRHQRTVGVGTGSGFLQEGVAPAMVR